MPAQRGGVVITGASTGIGHACAVRLRDEGFQVFAGVRKKEDAERLETEGVTALELDVTDGAAIKKAAAEVAQQLDGAPLAGLVNNAGIAVTAPLEFIGIDELRRQLEVNSVAPVAVTQAFLPQIRESAGRIVNISSIGGIVAQPFVGAYAMSKFAIEGMTDALRRELQPWGIHVAAIEPGTIKTPMWDKGLDSADETIEALGVDGRALYGERLERMRRFVPKLVERAGIPPEKVADAVAHALTAERPKLRYLVGDAKLLAAGDRLLPGRTFDRLMSKLV
jgi:NAD(P)-dependent dehydrogenase (short-subunit alcohol dehydrogenase family)